MQRQSGHKSSQTKREDKSGAVVEKIATDTSIDASFQKSLRDSDAILDFVKQSRFEKPFEIAPLLSPENIDRIGLSDTVISELKKSLRELGSKAQSFEEQLCESSLAALVYEQRSTNSLYSENREMLEAELLGLCYTQAVLHQFDPLLQKIASNLPKEETQLEKACFDRLQSFLLTLPHKDKILKMLLDKERKGENRLVDTCFLRGAIRSTFEQQKHFPKSKKKLRHFFLPRKSYTAPEYLQRLSEQPLSKLIVDTIERPQSSSLINEGIVFEGSGPGHTESHFFKAGKYVLKYSSSYGQHLVVKIKGPSSGWGLTVNDHGSGSTLLNIHRSGQHYFEVSKGGSKWKLHVEPASPVRPS